jgi:hypothetical protein
MSILSSYRWRRRLAWSAGFLLVAGAVAFAGVKFSTSEVGEAPVEGSAARFPREQKEVPLTGATKREIRRTLSQFITTAVARHNVDTSWDLAGPGLKQGLTRRDWARGDIPVQPYPAGRRGLGSWELVQFSYPRRVGLEVLLWPRRGAEIQPLSVEVDLVQGSNGRWLVDYWLPVKFRGGGEEPAPPAAGRTKRTERPEREAAPREPPLGRVRSRANPLWWALPTAIIALVVTIPGVILLVQWRRNRRAEASYLAGRR